MEKIGQMIVIASLFSLLGTVIGVGVVVLGGVAFHIIGIEVGDKIILTGLGIWAGCCALYGAIIGGEDYDRGIRVGCDTNPHT